jgi:molybdenum cofactor cytidylyltransferase
MFTLASELAAQGRRVVTTTTTRLFASQRAQSPAWCSTHELDRLGALLDEHGQCLVTAPDEAWEGEKARGIAPEQVVELAAREDVDTVLIEADGSRVRSFKAPAPHEPVIPPESTHVVYLVGADIFGKPLTAEYVHRPERMMALGGVEEGTPVTPDLVARVVTHPKGGLQHVPSSAYFLPFFNKLEDPADSVMVGEAAELLLQHERVREVLVGSLHDLHGGDVTARARAIQRRSRSAAVVLAAGTASRFGQTKQLLSWRGRTLVEHATEVALAVCETTLVVVGHEAEQVAHVVDHLPVEVIYNEQFAEGQGTSVAAGVAALMEGSRPFIGEAFFLLADQPFMTAELLRRIRAERGLRRIAVPRYEGKRGNPALFDAALFPELRAMNGDAGGRVLFQKYRDDIAWVDVDDEAVLQDVDTREQWRRLRERQWILASRKEIE